MFLSSFHLSSYKEGRIARRSNSLGHPGFTLVEVIVSTATLALIVVVLSSMLNHVSGIWRMGQAQAEKSETSRAILEFMAKELQAAQLPVGRTETSGLQMIVNPAQVTDPDKPRDQIFWQAPLATDQTLGDLAEIGYFVKWNNSNQKNPRALLCRFFSNPCIDGTTSNPNFKIYTDPNNWVTDTLLDTVSPADNTDPANPYEGLFVENVLALWVTCLDPLGNVITTDASGAPYSNTFDSRRGYTYTNSSGQSRTGNLPAAIDISFVLLDNTSASRVTTGLRDSIIALAADEHTKNANDFVISAQQDPRFSAIRYALRPCMTRVYIQNSK